MRIRKIYATISVVDGRNVEEEDMKIRVENDQDILCVKNDSIEVVVQNKKYTFDKSEIESAMLITTELGPFYDDMGLAIRIDEETAIFIMSEHPLFKKFLFDELSTIIDIDYEAVIKASSCVENNKFMIYEKNNFV